MAIVGMEREDALSSLQNSQYTFYLGGSRRMAQREAEYLDFDEYIEADRINITKDTDYDFYATFTEDLLEYLLAQGFSHTVSSIGSYLNGYSHYMDTEAIAIVEKDNVQVVLRVDALFYRYVFEGIPVDFYSKYLWKSSPHIKDVTAIQPIFNAMFAVARKRG